MNTSCEKASEGNLRGWQAGRAPQMLREDPKVLRDFWLVIWVPSPVVQGALVHVV